MLPRKFYLDDFFDDFVTSKDSFMKCDIYEKDGIYNIELDVPGFDKNDIKIECKDNYLTVTAKREKKEESNEKNYIRKERSYGEYTRSFYLGDIDTNLVNAKFNNGTLCITIPKEEKQNNKTIIEIDD
ncbi:MAG: Hsp20/alpha crystallin family protein [Bacilli bacterium]|nr:Hsp20/alpha crystallin family protein [Bacilli bacterium]